MSEPDPPYVYHEYPKMLYLGRVVNGRVELAPPRIVQNAREEHEAKAEGWFDHPQSANEAALRAHLEQQEADRHATVRHQVEVIKQALTEWQHGNAPAAPAASTRSPLGRNIEKLRKECGWTFEETAESVGISKDAVNANINHGTQPQVKTLKAYADAFSEALKRTITVEDLERE